MKEIIVIIIMSVIKAIFVGPSLHKHLQSDLYEEDPPKNPIYVFIGLLSYAVMSLLIIFFLLGLVALAIAPACFVTLWIIIMTILAITNGISTFVETWKVYQSPQEDAIS